MSKIIIDKQVLEDWIKYIDTFPLYPEDRAKLQSILQQSEEYNENENIEFADFCDKNSMDYNSTLNQWKYHKEKIEWKSTQELFEIWKNKKN